MPDTRRHRGPHPSDRGAFTPRKVPVLRRAVSDLSLLLERGYSTRASLALVGDRFQLTARQRLAVRRSACPETSLRRRDRARVPVEACRNAALAVDGYNLLITVESALAGGVLLVGRDGCVRDLASLHGTYRRVEETLPAIDLAGSGLSELGVTQVRWLLDAPVSNSGRLRRLLEGRAASHGWEWRVELARSPDPVLAESQRVVVTSDSWVLDRVERWTNLARWLIGRRLPEVEPIDLGGPGTDDGSGGSTPRPSSPRHPRSRG